MCAVGVPDRLRAPLPGVNWPLPLPGWVWAWMRWWRGVGEYKPYGPRNHAVRPKDAPRSVPKWAWARLKLNIGPAKLEPRYSGILGQFGAWIRNPRGGVEGISQAHAAGVRWIGLNLNKGDWTLPADIEVGRILDRSQKLGIPVIPWMRCRDLNDVHDVIVWGLEHNSKAICLNLEAELKSDLHTLQVRSYVDSVLRSLGYHPEVILFTEAWLYNAVDWKPFNDWPVVLEIFPRDSESANRPKDCIAHAHALGFKNVFVSYDGRDPKPKDAVSPCSVFTFDDAAGRWWSRG